MYDMYRTVHTGRCEPKAAAENSSGSIYSNEKIVPSKQVNGGRFGVQVPPAKYIGDKPVVGSHNATDSEKALGTGLMRQATHTEQRALTRINLTDETVLITGQNPPCRNCQGAMRKATANNNATIIYQWRENGVTKQAIWKKKKIKK